MPRFQCSMLHMKWLLVVEYYKTTLNSGLLQVPLFTHLYLFLWCHLCSDSAAAEEPSITSAPPSSSRGCCTWKTPNHHPHLIAAWRNWVPGNCRFSCCRFSWGWWQLCSLPFLSWPFWHWTLLLSKPAMCQSAFKPVSSWQAVSDSMLALKPVCCERMYK